MIKKNWMRLEISNSILRIYGKTMLKKKQQEINMEYNIIN